MLTLHMVNHVSGTKYGLQAQLKVILEHRPSPEQVINLLLYHVPSWYLGKTYITQIFADYSSVLLPSHHPSIDFHVVNSFIEHKFLLKIILL